MVWIAELLQASRALVRRPAFTASAVSVLALGLGAATAAFSLVDGVLIRPLPFPEPERVVELREVLVAPRDGAEAGTGETAADGNFLDWQAESRSFTALAAHLRWFFNLTGDGEPERLPGLLASAELFAVLDVEPALGRAFTPADAEAGAAAVVLGHRVWQRRYGGDPAIVGRTITVNGSPNTVLGVMPPGFAFPGPEAELWSLVTFSAEDAANRGQRSLRVIGRLAPGVDLEGARAEMATMALRLAAEHPEDRGWSVAVDRLGERLVGAVRPRILALSGAVVCLLLLSCASVAVLLLARGEARAGELALRKALGAGRGALALSAIAESVLVAVAAGALGALIARWGLGVLAAAGPDLVPRLDSVRLDGRALAFAIALTAAAGIAAGWLPSLRATRADPARLIAAGSRVGGRRGLGRALVVVEVALAMMLVVGAGLLARTLWRLSRVDTGFEPRGALVMSLSLSGPAYWSDPGEVLRFFHAAGERIAALPGVERVGWTSALPLSGGWWQHEVFFEDRPAPSPGEEPIVSHKVIEGYLEAARIELVSGRRFGPGDGPEAPPVVIVNRTFAERFFAGRDPIGLRIRRGMAGEERPWMTIVGVVEDERHYGLDRDADAEMYSPHAQQPFPYMSLVVRAGGDPMSLAPAVRRAIREVDPEQPVYGVATLERMAADSIAVRRTAGRLLVFFAALALLLAATGLYGLLAYTTRRRWHEMAVRLALGADRGRLRRKVVGDGAVLLAAGAALGLAGSLVLTRFLAALLYGVRPLDAGAFAAALLVLAAVGLLACYLPARAVTRIDPAAALRDL